MTLPFRPRMTAARQGISVIGKGHRRSWHGVLAEVWEAEGTVGAGGEYISQDPRLFILLDRAGGGFDLRLAPDRAPEQMAHAARQISFIPAGVPLWTRFDDATYIRHLDLHFDMEALRQRLGEDFSLQHFNTPRLMFSDPRMLNLAGLIADECAAPKAFHELYGDSLTTALLIEFPAPRRPDPAQAQRLASGSCGGWWTISRRTACAGSGCRNLAEMVDLSESHFSHAFKASTGMAPHQWQINERIKKVQGLLLRADMSLTDVAVAAGFFDQAHLTRVFRRIVGETPAAWRRDRRQY